MTDFEKCRNLEALAVDARARGLHDKAYQYDCARFLLLNLHTLRRAS